MLAIDARDRDKIVAPLFRTPRAFVLLVLILGALVALGLAAYLRQLILGLGVTAMDRPVYWSTYMVNFVFFIGISHAGTLK
jgi:molybdopterin-containing oxidoreductase family membrane subunit